MGKKTDFLERSMIFPILLIGGGLLYSRYATKKLLALGVGAALLDGEISRGTNRRNQRLGINPEEIKQYPFGEYWQRPVITEESAPGLRPILYREWCLTPVEFFVLTNHMKIWLATQESPTRAEYWELLDKRGITPEEQIHLNTLIGAESASEEVIDRLAELSERRLADPEFSRKS